MPLCRPYRQSSVVGYAGNELRKGSIGVVPQFVGIAEADGSVDLQSIKCNDECSDAVSFKILNNIGISNTFYYWINWYENPDSGETEACWVDDGYEKVIGMKIQAGQGMWVAGTSDAKDQIFTSSGQVGVEDVTVALRKGSVMTGNPTAVPVDLQDIICNDVCSDAVSFKILNNIGISNTFYYWINWYENPDSGETESCWVDDGYEKVIGMTIDPGQGMWVAGTADPVDPENLDPEVDQLITFPGVEL